MELIDQASIECFLISYFFIVNDVKKQKFHSIERIRIKDYFNLENFHQKNFQRFKIYCLDTKLIPQLFSVARFTMRAISYYYSCRQYTLLRKLSKDLEIFNIFKVVLWQRCWNLRKNSFEQAENLQLLNIVIFMLVKVVVFSWKLFILIWIGIFVCGFGFSLFFRAFSFNIQLFFFSFLPCRLNRRQWKLLPIHFSHDSKTLKWK